MEPTNPFGKPSPIVGPPIINNALNVPLQHYSNKYDEYYRPEYNQVWNRSNNQSALEQLGYGLTSRALSIAPKIGAGLGSIAGLAMAGTSGDVTQIWDNPITNWFNGLDDALKEKLPVYSSQQNDTSGLLGKMATTSFWANDAFDGIAYAASAFVPGTIIGKVAQGTSGALKATRIGKSIYDGLKYVGYAGEEGALAHKANLVLSTAYNTVSESAAEAFQTQKELEAIYSGMGLDPKDAKAKAGGAAARVFNANLAALVAPNLIQNTFFHGGWNKLNDEVRAQVWKDGTTENIKKLNSVWSKIGGSVASEGFWEENIQTSLQQWERNAAISGNNGDARSKEIALNMANNIGGFVKSFLPGAETPEEIEGATSIFLGGLIGAGAAARGYVQEKKSLESLKSKELERYNNLFNIEGKAAIGIMADNVNSIYKSNGKKIVSQDGKDVEVEDFVLDANNQPIIDEEAVHKMTVNQLRNKHLWDAQMIAAYRNDPALAEMNKHMALGSYVYSLMNNKYEYTPEEVNAYLDKMAETGNEEAKVKGVETHVTENMALAKEYARQLSTIRNNNTSIAKDVSSNPKEARFSDFITKTEFYLQLKRNALLEIQKQATTDAAFETITKLLEDNAAYLHQIKNERSAIKSEFDKTVIDTSEKEFKLAKARKEGDPSALGLSYQIAEDKAINGNWSRTENSRDLPSQESRIATKIEPGTRDTFQYASGKSIMTTDRVATALQNEEDIADIASQFVRGVKVIPAGLDGLVKTQQQEIADRLDAELTRVGEEGGSLMVLADLSGSLSEEDYDFSIADVIGGSTEMEDTAIEGILTEVNSFGSKFTLESPTGEVVESDAWKQFTLKNDAKLRTLSSRLQELDDLKEQVSQFSFENDRMQAYEKAADKEEFLKKEYYTANIGKPTEAFFKIFKSAPEDLSDDSLAYTIKTALESAIAGSDIESIVEEATEALKYLTSVVLPQINKNIYNRGKIHKTINNKIANAVLSSIPLNLITPQFNEQLAPYLSKIKQDDVVSFDAIVSLLEAVRNLSPEVRDSVINAVEGYSSSLVTNYITSLYDTYPELSKQFDSLKGTTKLQERVYYHAQNLIVQHFDKKYGDNTPVEIQRFKADLDMYLLNKSVGDSSILDSEDKELVRATSEVYFKLIGSSSALGVLKSTLDVSKLERFKETFTDKVPSLQQNIALTQALVFLHSKTETDDFNSWMLVRGIGGSGKTHFLGQELKRAQDELLGRPSKVMAFSKEAMTSANINKAVFGDGTSSTYQDFLNLSVEDLAKFDFLVIDEVFTFTNPELYDMYRKISEAKVKVIALGDASQLTAEESPAILTALSVNMTIPLTTSYRTNITSISAFIDKYRLNANVVDSHIATANLSVEDAIVSPSTTYGVLSMSPDALDMMLRTPSTRSRVLIVSSQTAKASLLGVYKGVDIRTAAEAQGIQWDEVYSLMENSSSLSPFQNNRAFYTAYSRAKSLLVVADSRVVNSAPSNELEVAVKNSDNELANIKAMFSSNLDEVAKLQDILKGVASFTNEELAPVDVVHNLEPTTDPFVSYAMATEHIEDPADLVTNFTGTEFFNPSNFGLTDFEGGARLQRGSVVHFVRTDKGSIFIVAENRLVRGSYFKLAKLGKDDFEGPASSLFNNISKVNKAVISENLLTRTDEFDIPDINRLSIGEVPVADYLKFKTLYGGDYHSTTTGLLPGANDLIEDAIIRFYTTYNIMNKLTTDKPWVSKNSSGNWKVNWANIPKSAVTMVVPTKRATTSDTFGWNSDYHNPRRLNIYHGVPYLVIRPSEKSNSKPLLIRFQPKMLAKNNMYVNTLRDFTNLVKSVESQTNTILSSTQFEKLVKDYAHTNFKVEEGQLVRVDNPIMPEGFPSTGTLMADLNKLVDMLFTAKESIKRFGSEENAKQYLEDNGTPQAGTEFTILNGKVIVGIEKRGEKLFVLKQSADPTDPNVTTPYKEWSVSEGDGIAQKALNSLAAANNKIGNLKFRQMQERAKATEEKDPYKIKVGRSPSILMSGAYTDYQGFYKDPWLQEYLTNEQIENFSIRSEDPTKREGLFSDLVNALEASIVTKENATRTDAREFAISMIKEYETAPITVELLDKITSDKAFDANGEHTSLRTPIKLHTPSKEGIHDLGDKLYDESVRNKLSTQLRHNFEGFQRTQVWFTSPEVSEVPATVTEPTPVSTTTVKDLLRKVGNTGIKVYDDIIALLSRLNIDAPVVHLPNGIPYEEDGIIKYGLGAATSITNGVASIEYSGYLFNRVDTSTEAVSILLHEALHVASKQALHKGQADAKKKLSTKEADFYKRIISIKKRFDAAIRSKRNPENGKRLKTSDVYLKTYSKLDVNEFVANLSNPEFVELAKSISLLPGGTKKSMLRELLEAIVDFFKSIVGGNPSVYDAAIASLEEYYKDSSQPRAEYVQPAITITAEDVLSSVTSQLNKLGEFTFDSSIEGLKQQWSHIINVDSFPEFYGDDFTLELTAQFSSMSPIEQSLLLNQANVSGAWYDLTKDRITYSTGSIRTSAGITLPVDKLLDEDMPSRLKNLIRSVVRQEVLGNKVLDDLVSLSPSGAMDVLFEKVLSNTDKQYFRADFRTTTNEQTKALLLQEDNPAGQGIREAIQFLTNNWQELRQIIEWSRDRSTSRYRVAKSFVESVIKANLELDKATEAESTRLIKTIPFVKKELEDLANDPNPTLPSGLTLVEAETLLKSYYEQIKQYRKVASNPLQRNELLFIKIPALENEITAIRALGTKDDVTGKLVIDLILKDIYPNSDFATLQEFETELLDLADAEFINSEDIEPELLELAGISEYIKKYDQSYENTLSESLKNSFRRITLGSKTISPALAYIKTMQVVMSLDWNTEKNEAMEGRPEGLDYILEQLKLIVRGGTSKLQGAIIQNIVDVITYSRETNFFDTDLNFGDRTLGIVMFKDESSTIQYAAYSANPNVRNHTTLTYQEIIYRMQQGDDIKLSQFTKDTTQLYNWLHTQVPLSIKQFNRLFTKGESLNTIRAIQNTMASMKETELYSANRSNKKGNEFRFQRGISTGVSSKLKDQLISNLVSMYERGDLNSAQVRFENQTVNGEKINALRNTGAGKAEYIKLFFKFLGIHVDDLELTRSQTNELINDIEGFLLRTKGIEAYTLEDELGDDVERTFDIYEWLETSEGVDGYLSRFSSKLGLSDKLVRNASVRDVNGNKFYKNHESSHLYDTLLNLIELNKGNPVFRGGTGSDSQRIIPDFLKSDYYNHNIFARGSVTNRLHSVIEIDGARNLGNNSVTEYTRENMFFFYHRNFSQQFVDAIRQHKTSYFQSTFTPSDSPKALAVRVDVLSDNPIDGKPSQILNSIELVFKQLLERRGLSGAKFERFDKSIEKDLFRNFGVGLRALNKLGIKVNDLTEADIPRVSRTAYELMSIEASALLDELTDSNVKLSLDKNMYKYVLNIKDKLNAEQFPNTIDAYGTQKNPTPAITNIKGEYSIDKTLLKPVFDLWFKNNYINGYFMNQLVTGDYAAYANSGAIIKRFAGIKGPRIRPLIDPIVGMKATRKVLILGDEVHSKDEARILFANLLYDVVPNEAGELVLPEDTTELDIILDSLPDKFDSTDAQGFSTKQWIAELSRGFEAAWGLGDIHKPIHFGLEKDSVNGYTTAKPTYNKYSSVVLDEAMTKKFQTMRKLQLMLEKLGVDEAIFKTGTKLGVPTPEDSEGVSVKLPTLFELLAYRDEQLENFRDSWKVNSIVELSNKGYGLQFNAAADPNKQVALFTQLMYFLNTYPDQLATDEFGTTQDAAKEVYELVGTLIGIGRERFLKEIGTTRESMVKFLKNALTGSGSERALQLLEEGISIDNPLIEKKAVITLASGLEKATIKTKFKGGKLVLQTPEGISKYQDPKLFSQVDNELAQSLTYRKELLPNGKSIIVAECIVPKEMLTASQIAAIQNKDSIYLMPDMLGFRLPSTEFHSALAIRVVGVYSNRKANVIIAPKELVPIQGQDFDVDSIFAITQELFSKNEVSVVSGEYLKEYADILHNLLHELSVAEDELEPQHKGVIYKLRKAIKRDSGLLTDPLEDAPTALEDRVNAIIDSIKGARSNEDVSTSLSEVLYQVSKFKTLLKTKAVVIGEENAPVGYKLVKGKYVIDTEFLANINNSIESLRSITHTNEIMPSLNSTIRSELKKAESLREKYIKNRILDIMLTVISDRNNASRSFTAISFNPLDEAIAQFKGVAANLVVSNDNLDLAHPRDQFTAYLSVASGQILIGAFANASKSFGYIARAGGDERSFVKLNTLKQVLKQVEANPEFNAAGLIAPFYKDEEIYNSLLTEFTSTDTIKKLIAEEEKQDNFTNRYKVGDNVPVLNPNQAFVIEENGTQKKYDRLAAIDSDNKYRTTQSYSTLTNAAVDDLNQGYLSRVRINTNTGPAIMGMVALGVPFRLAIKILYQPILASLSGGKINNLDVWISSIRKEYGSALDAASIEPVSVENDLDPFIFNSGAHGFQSMSVSDMLEKMTPAERESQIKVLALFIKANKIGTDFKNLASFLNILRAWDVLVEKIEQVEDNLVDKIGHIVDLPNGEVALQPNTDFSFNIPNLLEGSKHIKEAYLSHRALQNKIKSTFRIHSAPIAGLAEKIYEGVTKDSANRDKKNVTLVEIKRALQYYLMVGEASSGLPKETIIKYKDTKLVSSGTRTFLNNVAQDVKKVQEFARANGDSNLFLENIVTTFDKYNTARLIFKTGVGLQPEDQLDLVLGFKLLNQYRVVNGKVEKYLPDSPTEINDFQKDLVKYSVLTSGLQYGGSGFSSYVTPSSLESYDRTTNDKLDALAVNGTSKGFRDHFTLSYTLLNAAKLPWVPYEQIVPFRPSENRKDILYSGYDELEGGKVFYDFKSKLQEDSKGAIIKPAEYVRRDFGKSITVYRLVKTTAEMAYYQIVGKSNNVVFSPVDRNAIYQIDSLFTATEPSIYYHYKDGDKLSSYSKLLDSLKVGDEVYIYPSYSYDRREREKVMIKSKTKSDIGGTQVTVEPVLDIAPPITVTVYPVVEEEEDVIMYTVRLQELGYTEEEIGKAIKQNCQ